MADFNCSARTNAEAGLATGLPGEVITARVGDTFMTEAQGFWESQRDGPLGHLSCNPYAGVRILIPADDPMSKVKCFVKAFIVGRGGNSHDLLSI